MAIDLVSRHHAQPGEPLALHEDSEFLLAPMGETRLVFLWGVPCLSWQWEQTPPLVRLRRTTARERLGDTTLHKVYINAMLTRPGSGSETA